MNTLPIDKLQDIWQLATTLHDGQKYGGPQQGQRIEYLNHIGSVVFEVLNAAAHTPDMDTELALTCALLHDSVEDTAFTPELLLERFGPRVTDGVLALTKNETLPNKHTQMMDSLARIKQQPKEVWAVKLADRICNLYAPPYYWNSEKKRNYQAEARLIYEELKDGNAYLAKRLAKKITDYEAFMP